jgi:uncharacterized small protein (TIGR04563 family)
MGQSSQTVYFPRGMLEEIEREAARLGRSASSLVVEAWRLARTQIMSFSPDREDPAPDSGDDPPP